MNTVELRQITDFLSRYRIAQINPETLLLTSSKNNLLVKYHSIENGDEEEIIEILDKHLSFDSDYVCPLLHFERCEDDSGEGVLRAVYQLDKMTLKQSMDLKRENQEHFRESQLWILLSSLVNSLIYLQEKDVVYGVLSPNKIFIEDKIRIMDPSAFNINPVNISRLSLHSPEIKLNRADIDFYMSDVYLLGLCILSAATLIDLDNKLEDEELDALLEQVEQTYSSDLLHVLKYMLKLEVQQRPTFQNIREYIETEIQIREEKIGSAQPLCQDEQDSIIEHQHLQTIDKQCVDFLQPNQVVAEEVNEYEQARQRYLQTSRMKSYIMATNCQTSTIESIEHLESIDFINQKQTVNLKSSNYYVQEFKLNQYGSHPSSDTILKNKKRVHQIKNRNSQNVKAIHSIMIPNHHRQSSHELPFTSPELMSMLKQETDRAREFFAEKKR